MLSKTSERQGSEWNEMMSDLVYEGERQGGREGGREQVRELVGERVSKCWCEGGGGRNLTE